VGAFTGTIASSRAFDNGLYLINKICDGRLGEQFHHLRHCKVFGRLKCLQGAATRFSQ